MKVRKEMRVHAKSLTYSGFSDFGDTADASDDPAQRSFGDRYSQPIAVFASKRPTKGRILAQLILKAICLLEEAGAFVDMILYDGASTNRLM
ncbi:hypothetical protein HPB48_018102 [Haemaphysalis longicornis]|uniref:Transposable element P transposase-like RNase H domain-containing protein n=1 Tax=Haemaphysalis longicornis TaxID=44386 RepID=A0A9J6GUM5_HAELO|nr:hypothetical protein HPB48_018102 [Haemaphysalis longicornis]